MPVQIAVPFSQQIYDSKSDKVHSIRIIENDSGSKEDRRRFRYLLQIGSQDPVTVKLEILPENDETLKRLIDYGIQSSAAEAEKEEKYQKVVSLVDDINRLLNDFSEKIPEERVTGDHSYKVSGSWFQKSLSVCRLACLIYLPSHSELAAEIETFFQVYGQKRWDAADAMIKEERVDNFVKTTREEIASMNELLNKTMNQLKIEFNIDDDFNIDDNI